MHPDNVFTAATNKANIGFAQLGLGQIEAGKRLAEQAVEEYERAGAVAEIGDIARRVRPASCRGG